MKSHVKSLCWCALLLIALSIHRVARSEAQDGCPASYAAPAADRSEPVNLGQLKRQLRLYYRCSYQRDVEKVLQEARVHIEQRATAASRPAIVLDIDETALSNWAQMSKNDFGYVAEGPCTFVGDMACGWHAWEHMAAAPAIEPTLELFKSAIARNVAVFFVTGRTEGEARRAATEVNLRRFGYEGWTRLIMKGSIGTCVEKDTTAYKRCARKSIADENYTIIANVGDQWSDLDPDPSDPRAGSFSERIFKVPNPFYFIP